MITAGIDCGTKNIKAVVLDEGKIKGMALISACREKAAECAYNEALKNAGLERRFVKRVVATGSGKNQAYFKDETVTSVIADAAGIHFLMPEVRTIIYVGAEEGRTVKVDGKGKVVDFIVNEKCAAGAGAFTESMARALEIPLEDFGAVSLESTMDVPLTSQCVVFAESEVVSLLHKKIPKNDIAHAINNAVADRIASMARMTGITPEVALIGGVAKNIGFANSLKRFLDVDIRIPDNCEFIGAIGAASIAADLN